ncbi:MAG: hypothetical protein WEF86_05635 [Gemmatimonadota bacterium]
MATAALLELRQALECRFPDALPLERLRVPVVGTGVAELDALLPGGGLARGRLTAWLPGGGATAVLRAACEAAVRRGERAAWVDAAGVQSAEGWRSGPLLVRPAGRREALSSAEELLRSGGFAVVVIIGTGREAGSGAVRLSRAAKAGGAALVVVTAEPAVAHLRAVSRLQPDGFRWRCDPFGEPVDVVAVRVEVEAAALGWSGRTSFELPVRTHQTRLAPEPRLVDRRGAPGQVRWRRVRRSGQSGDGVG